MRISNHKGFGLVIVLILLIVATVFIFIGYRVFINSSSSQTSSTVNSQETIQPEPTKQELESSLSEIESVNLEQDLDLTDLDNDINSVL